MFKVIGSIMVLFSSVFVCSRKVLESYFTYKFLQHTEQMTETLIYERGKNLSYDKVFEKIDFDKKYYISATEKNGYINKEELLSVKEFLDNLGKRDSNSEKIYIDYNLKNIKRKKEIYYRSYCDNRKVYTLYGCAIGLFIIIFFI